MRFWESSALVPLLATESSTSEVEPLAQEDPEMVVWWGTEVECISAIARTERAGLPGEKIAGSVQLLRLLSSRWREIAPTTTLRESAKRLLRSHPLRAGDALQIAAALMLADGDPSSVEIVTLDDRLRDAASREGFVLLPKRSRS